jgi:hypothetical protein
LVFFVDVIDERVEEGNLLPRITKQASIFWARFGRETRVSVVWVLAKYDGLASNPLFENKGASTNRMGGVDRFPKTVVDYAAILKSFVAVASSYSIGEQLPSVECLRRAL